MKIKEDFVPNELYKKYIADERNKEYYPHLLY
ncbi:hypothetical protein PEDI_32950 [Persicobacter diffluens]|uniref:Uncharacterized protein n=1 Tax=Persicobacter diffluens TaxID=981 RepID=A0AAN5AND6_9BACT|nr:hypothetical protein PEDI_32950 [Persicobacter diffluens]